MLLNESGLTVSFDGSLLDPADAILHDTWLDVEFGEYLRDQARIRVIEWKSGKHRAIYFGPDGEHFFYEEPGSDIEGQYPYSAYVTWDGLDAERVGVLAAR